MKPRVAELRPAFPANKTTPTVTHKGIYCDCYGTLFSFNVDKDQLLVDYLNAQHAMGTRVVLVTTNIKQVRDKIRNIGLHEDIVRALSSKSGYIGAILETWIDDDPVLLTAAQQWKSDDPVFRQHMEDFLANKNDNSPNFNL